ncbi:hypothetical protein LTR56_002773 [Elasticomyces elasticus]|nr:hypothetical protein LTR56_002773 [Elasticomyces elasticus]KAK3666770.1 hypothetical protein LTR22_002357 [Elasticomyces elasticus]KAK4918794.1 hypothetical protein LTR49_013425 [Elasticomyces elasticus]KAK5758711.1 hypothetical protein LTS12_011105 [Elasticomyces elasticus]
MSTLEVSHVREPRRRLSVNFYTTPNRPPDELPRATPRHDPTSTESAPYQYATDLCKLNSRPGAYSDHIRLLRIIPCLNGQISGELAIFSLSHAPRYAALSYSWGAGDQSSVALNITESVNDRQTIEKPDQESCRLKGALLESMTITRDLQNALRRLQRHNVDLGWFWIDAICVNQAHPAERSNQVSMMRSIYQQANHVYVWLGEAVGDAADYAVDINACFGFSQSDLVNLLELEGRAWWSRLWVMQELALGRDVVMCLGSATSGWTDFVDWMNVTVEANYLRVQTHNHIGGIPAIRAHKDAQVRLSQLDRVRKSFQTNGDLPLWLLLEYSAEARTTERLDKIIGLLGLTSQKTRECVPASYENAPAALFSMACVQIIEEARNLDILVGRWSGWSKGAHRLEDDSFPSWVPDFARQVRSHPRFGPSSFLPCEQEEGGMYGSGSTARASGSSVAQPLHRDGRVIYLAGLLVGHVSSVQSIDILVRPASVLPVDEEALETMILEHLVTAVLPFVSRNIDVSRARHFGRTLATSFADPERSFSAAPSTDGRVTPLETRLPAGAKDDRSSENIVSSELGTLIKEMIERRSVLQPGWPKLDPYRKMSQSTAELYSQARRWVSFVGKLLDRRVLFATSQGFVGVVEGSLGCVSDGVLV